MTVDSTSCSTDLGDALFMIDIGKVMGELGIDGGKINGIANVLALLGSGGGVGDRLFVGGVESKYFLALVT